MTRHTLSALDRRQMMKTLGLLAPAYFLPSLAGARKARAAGTVPTRVVFFWGLQGTLYSAWKPKAPGGGEPTADAWEFSDMLAPLAPFRNKVNLVSGLDCMYWWNTPSAQNAGNAHQMGNYNSLRNDAGPSIDQFIAQKLRAQGVQTFLPSLEMRVLVDGDHGDGDSPISPSVPIESNPAKAFARLFPNGQGGGGTTVVDKTPAQNKSVLDFVAKEFAAVSPRLSKDDRAKLDAHGQVVRDLETRLSGDAVMAKTCPTVDQASLSGGAYNYNTGCDRVFRLATAALACDLTRVITMPISFPPDAMWGCPGGYHDMCHANAMTTGGAGFELLKKAQTIYAQKFAQFLKGLDDIPESDGRTLLDHTVVLWCNQIATGGHSTQNWKYVLAGSGGGFFKTGKFLSYGNYMRSFYDPKGRGLPHSNLFVSMAKAAGVNIDLFGSSTNCTGPLTDLHA